MSVIVNDQCIGCGACVAECPASALELNVGSVSVIEGKCVESGACVAVCPVNALSLPKKSKQEADRQSSVAGVSEQNSSVQDNNEKINKVPEGTGNTEAVAAPIEPKDKSRPSAPVTPVKVSGTDGDSIWHDVWVVIEYNNGEVAPVSWELLGEGRKLADARGCRLCGCLIGYKTDDVLSDAFAYGAETVYVMDDPVLEHYRTEPYTAAINKLITQYKPEIVLMGATSIGRDVFPAVATYLKAGLTADCTVLDIDPETGFLLQTRPAFGGNIMATILCRKSRPQMATVRPRVMAMPEKVPGRTGHVIKEDLGLKEEDVLTKVLKVIESEGQNAFLDKAEIIVSVGMGVGSAKNMGMIENLATVLGATIAGTRGAVEAGWIRHDQQIGQTGITVRPKVYIAVGISGAIQHLVGMETSDCIIAINSDREAPIFRVANYGIVGDLFQIVPALTEEFKKRLQYGLVK